MKTLFIVLFMSISLLAHAQYSVTGTVKDAKDSSPVSYATIALLRSDSSVVTGAVTDDNGKFVMEKIMKGNYLLQVSYLGYDKAYRKVNVPEQSDLGVINIKENATQLGEVTVTASRPQIEQKVDRYIVNVSTIQSAGRNALNVLSITPGILVNPTGDISMMGNGVAIWIDGRPTNLSGDQLKSLLTSMQGNEIDRIEVITNPPARYEAEGTGGIINIRTKKGLQMGLNGSVNVGYTQGYSDRENAGLSFNYRESKVNIYGNYGFSHTTPWNDFESITNIYTNDGWIEYYRKGTQRKKTPGIFDGNHQLRLGSDFFINPKNTVGFLFNGNFSSYVGERTVATTTLTPAYQGTSFSSSNGVDGSRGNNQQINLNYQGTFDRPGQQLNVDLDYGRFYSKSSESILNDYFDPDSTLINQEQQQHNNPQNIILKSIKADYTQPTWKGSMLGFGGKISQSKTDNNILYEEYNYDNSTWETDVNLTNHFNYTEQIDAFYVNLEQKVGDKWDFQAGLRGEYTQSKGNQITLNEINKTDYFNLFPTFFISYKTDKGQYKFSYGRRIRRPGYSLLDPFEYRVDAYSFTIGNPNLKPDYTNNFLLGYSYKQLMVNLNYNYRTGQIAYQPIIKGNMYGTMPINFKNRQNLTLGLNYSPSVTKFWSINLYSEGAYVLNRAGNFDSRGFVGMINLNNRLIITKKLSAEVNGFYMSNMAVGYYVNKAFGNLSGGLRQLLLDDKLTIALSVNDILKTSISKSTANTGQVNQWTKEYYDSRWINLSVTYNFGSKTVKGSRYRSTGNEDEVERAQ